MVLNRIFAVAAISQLILQPFTSAIATAASATSIIIEHIGIKYLVSENAVATINGYPSTYKASNPTSEFNIQQSAYNDSTTDQTIIPITVINPDPNAQSISSQWLKDTLTSMLSADDVLGPLFTQTVVFIVPDKMQQVPTVSNDTIVLVGGLGVKEDLVLLVNDEVSIPSGPYFMKGRMIHQAMRLYPDPYGAFMYGTTQTDDGFIRPNTDLIPVPSRLYTTSSATASHPLSGKRIAIKDIISLRNLPTTASSKDYALYHGTSLKTARAIQSLTSLGAVIIGKTKTTQFANGETARDWIDFQCPFNPRADGYLDPAGSSTGSAAAVAGYEWVDFAVGTDSCGSIIWPAALQGVYGLRPTFGVSDLEGVMPYSSVMDTMGFFVRDIQSFRLLQKVWYKKTEHSKLNPSKIIVPTGVFDSLSQDKKSIIAKFIEDAESTSGLHKTDVDIDILWKSSGFSPGNISYTDYLYSTVAHIQIHDSYTHESAFYNNYEKRFGRYPYINPMVRHKWEIHRQNISTLDYEEALHRMSIFKSFLDSYVFKDGAVMMLPAGGADIMYRDELVPPESIDVYLQSFGFDNTFYSILGGLPSVVVPVGQRPIKSKVTKETAWEPVSMMIVGQAGSEDQIIELVETILEKSGRPLGVKVGDRAF